MLRATITIEDLDLPHSAGHARAALARAGFEDVSITKKPDGFRARGIRGRSAMASLAACTPLAWTGLFSRSGVELSCKRSLNDGDETLHATVRIRSFREFEDYEETDWLTRGPGEMLGDAMQNRRILRKVMKNLALRTDAKPEGFGVAREGSDNAVTRNTKFKERYKKGKRRRKLQLLLVVLVGITYGVADYWLRRS